jgi:hypothetical protein
MTRRIPLIVAVTLIGLLITVCIRYWAGHKDGKELTKQHTTNLPEGSHSSPAWRALERRAKTESSPPSDRRRLLLNFPAMRSPHERMSLSTRMHINETIGAPPDGLDPNSAQHVDTPSGGIWVVSGKYITCMLQGNLGSLACDTSAAFSRQGLALGTAKPPKRDGGSPRDFQVLGIAPVWVRSVQVQIGDHARAVAAQDGMYTRRANVPIIIKRFCRRVTQACSTN